MLVKGADNVLKHFENSLVKKKNRLIFLFIKEKLGEKKITLQKIVYSLLSLGANTKG